MSECLFGLVTEEVS